MLAKSRTAWTSGGDGPGNIIHPAFLDTLLSAVRLNITFNAGSGGGIRLSAVKNGAQVTTSTYNVLGDYVCQPRSGGYTSTLVNGSGVSYPTLSDYQYSLYIMGEVILKGPNQNYQQTHIDYRFTGQDTLIKGVLNETTAAPWQGINVLNNNGGTYDLTVDREL